MATIPVAIEAWFDAIQGGDDRNDDQAVAKTDQWMENGQLKLDRSVVQVLEHRRREPPPVQLDLNDA